MLPTQASFMSRNVLKYQEVSFPFVNQFPSFPVQPIDHDSTANRNVLVKIEQKEVKRQISV